MGEKLDTLNEGIRIGRNIVSDVKWKLTPGWKRQIIVREHAETTRRQLAYYCDQLEKNEQIFRMKARESEQRGSHAAAVTAARYVLTLRKMRDRAEGMMMRFEMMQSMKDMKVAQQDFVQNCIHMGKLMAPGINPASWVNNTESLRDAMRALDTMDSLTQSMFGPIDFDNPYTRNVTDQDAEELLGDIMHVYGAGQYKPLQESVTVEPTPVPVTAEPVRTATALPPKLEKPKMDPEAEALLRDLKARANGR